MIDCSNFDAMNRDDWIAYLRIKYAEELAILDANGIWYEFAEYNGQETRRFQGNPWIEALPHRP